MVRQIRPKDEARAEERRERMDGCDGRTFFLLLHIWNIKKINVIQIRAGRYRTSRRLTPSTMTKGSEWLITVEEDHSYCGF